VNCKLGVKENPHLKKKDPEVAEKIPQKGAELDLKEAKKTSL